MLSFRRALHTHISLLALMLANSLHPAMADCVSTAPPGYETAMHVDWRDGIPPWAGMQTTAQRPGKIIESPAHTQAKLHIEISRNDSFAHVANGVPRAELSLGRTHFADGNDYVLDWSTTLSRNFPIDHLQPEIVTQIVEGGLLRGAPPVALIINGDHYELRVHSDVPHSMRAYKFGSITADRGRAVCWRLHYVPNTAGRPSTTELYRNGIRVVAEHDLGNAYASDDEASLKIGVYKWLWLAQPSDVQWLSLDYGNVTLYRKQMPSKDPVAPSGKWPL